MKSEADVRSRLDALRAKYLKRHVRASQQRAHRNCVHNAEHKPRPLPYSRGVPLELERAPRRSVSLVVIQDESQPVRICMFGAESPSTWRGDTCDSDEISDRCPMFKPVVSAAEAALEFDQSLEDDKAVMRDYPDVAALQWVLGERLHTREPLTYRIRRFLAVLVASLAAFFGRRRALRNPSREPPADSPISKGFWD